MHQDDATSPDSYAIITSWAWSRVPSLAKILLSPEPPETPARLQRRLGPLAGPDRLAEGIHDAAEDRSFGLPVIDTTGRTAEDVAADLARFVRRLEQGSPEALLADRAGGADDSSRATLRGPRVTIRPGGPDDVAPLRAVLADESVTRWWGEPEPASQIAANLRGDGSSALLAVEIDGQVAGGHPVSRRAGPAVRARRDRHLPRPPLPGPGRWRRGGWPPRPVPVRTARPSHRITIDPAAANRRAIRCYQEVGFRPAGVMRRYERGADGRFHNGLLMDLIREDLPL